MSETFDVVAVDLKTNKVRVMDTNKSRRDADAFVKIAVMRRGIDDEFFSEVLSGRYRDGETWDGRGY